MYSGKLNSYLWSSVGDILYVNLIVMDTVSIRLALMCPKAMKENHIIDVPEG
jgi:hypothetical protein